jgi:CMP-N-acetylneuraminic acid synthetase
MVYHLKKAFSAYAEEINQSQLLAVGLQQHIFKSVDLEKLLKVDFVCNSRQNGRTGSIICCYNLHHTMWSISLKI